MSNRQADPIDLGALRHLTKEENAQLQENQLILAGLWEQSPQGTKLYREQVKQVKANITQAQALEKQRDTVAGLRKRLADLEKSLDIKYNQWQQAEAEMTSALLPFSAPGIRKDLENLVGESQDVVKALEESFMSDTSQELPEFLREYEQQQVLKHMRKLKAASI